MENNTVQQNIPSGWKLKKLSDVLDYERPDAYIVKNTSYSDKAKTPVLTANKSFILGYTDEDFGVYKNVPAIIFDDFTTDSKLVDFPFKIKSSAIKILKEKNRDINLRFVFEKMKSVNFPTGSHKRFYISQYQNLEIALPPIKEQQKIAEILGAVDEDIAKTQELIDTTEKLKRGLMQQLFTLKKDWIDTVLSDVATIIMGQSPSSKNYNESDEGLPLIQGNADIKNRKSIKRFSTSEITKEIKKGDIIMSVRAPVGSIAVSSFDSCIGRGICGIQPKNIDKEYLYYFLINKENEFEKKAQGSTFTAINSNEVRKIKIVFPKKTTEQKEIAEILSAVDEKILINNKLKEKLTLLKKGLMQDLLSGTVRTNI